MADKKKLFPKLAKKEAKGNVFTSLFDEDKAKKDDSQSEVVDSVMKKTTKKGSILGPKPKTDNLKIAERPSSLGGSLFKLVVFLWVLVLVGSYLTMGASFDVAGLNQTLASEDSVSDIKEAQAEFNADNYLVAYYYLDSFAYLADSYLYKKSQYESAYTSSNTKASLEPEIEELETDLMLALSLVQERLAVEIVPEGIEIEGDIATEMLFKEATVEYLEELAGDLGGDSEDVDVQLELAGLNGALALLKNGAFVKEVVSADSDSISEIVDGFGDITSDNFTIISGIKSDRQNWSEIIKEIESVTKEVDPLYGTSVQSDISYSSYGFDSSAKTISLQGSTTTDDTRNFTLIVNLIDALEESSLFMDIEERSFSKSDSSEEESTEYEARFRLEFSIQDGEDSRDASFSLEEEEGVARSEEEDLESGDEETETTES